MQVSTLFPPFMSPFSTRLSSWFLFIGSLYPDRTRSLCWLAGEPYWPSYFRPPLHSILNTAGRCSRPRPQQHFLNSEAFPGSCSRPPPPHPVSPGQVAMPTRGHPSHLFIGLLSVYRLPEPLKSTVLPGSTL